MALLERQLRLLDYLKGKNQWIKGIELAEMLNVTDRTVRNDIIAIKDTYGEEIIESVRTKGYRYNEIEIKQDKSDYNMQFIVTPTERNIYILKKLIIADKPLSIFDIAEELFVSERTIESDISYLKKIINKLNKKDVTILREGEYVSIMGKSTTNILYDVAKEQLPELQCNDMQKFFMDINLEFISSVVIGILNKHNFVSRYLSITKLIIDIALIVEMHYYHKLSYCDRLTIIDIEVNKEIEEYCSKITEDIHREISEIFAIELKSEEIKLIEYLLYINRKMDVVEYEIKNSDILKDDFYNFCLNEIIKISEDRGINYASNEQLVRDLIVHIKIAIERVKLGIKLDNPLADYIKSKYSYLLDEAIIISDKISEEYNIDFDFNEISYIAAYLATMVHEVFTEENSKDKLNILLFISEGMANLRLIQKQIEVLLKGKNISVVGVTEFNVVEESLASYDLVITTSNRLNVDLGNIIIIKESFNNIDKKNIENHINNIILDKELYKFMKIVNEYLDPKLFIKNMDVETKEEAISELCKVLYENKYVGNDFEGNVLVREMVVSTETESGIALPHSIVSNAMKNGIAIGILKNPVLWSERKVKVIVMIAFGNKDMHISNYFIRFFVDNVLDSTFVENLRRCTDLQEVQKILTKYFFMWVQMNA